MSILVTEIMTYSGAITTYKAKKRSDDRIVVCKVLCPAERNVSLWNGLYRMKEWDSRYIIKYSVYDNNEKDSLV